MAPNAHLQPDPILAAIRRHVVAWTAFQTTPPEQVTEQIDTECFAALDAVLATACSTRWGALALLQHLHWWLAAETANAAVYGESWRVAKARAADLSLFLGANHATIRIPLATPLGRLVPNASAATAHLA